MEKVLTVVIPSFNVEKYLRQTLESLRNEEFNRRHSKDWKRI